ncbi:MAG: efflux RND transporter permease subunit, partial [Cloacibacillus porcorum]|nr:efflux RND transporter permease subunit [Cloacibacillus porcorum]
AMILKPSDHKPKFILFKWFNSFFDRLTHGFSSSVRVMLKHGVVVFVVFLLFLGATAQMAVTLPTSLVPDEDQVSIKEYKSLPDGGAVKQTE